MKKYLIYLVGVLFLFIPKDAFAETIMPLETYLDGVILNNAFGPTNNTVTKYTNPSSKSFQISFEVLIQSTDLVAKYPYVVLYFKSGAENLTVTRIGTCNQSCFSSTLEVAKIGKTTWSGFNAYSYALVLPISKYYINNNSSVIQISDVLKFTTTDNTDRPYEFINAYFSNENILIGNNYSDFLDMINKQNQNTQDIINNQNQNKQDIINNQNQNQQQTNDRLDNINDSLTDTTLPNVNGVFDGISAGENQVADLILLPINILRKYTDFTSKSCIPYSIPFGIFGSDYTLTLPCINLENYLGSALWNTIDSLCCFFFIYEFIMLIINAFDSITSFKDTYEGLYQPKHGPDSYQPRHGGD